MKIRKASVIYYDAVDGYDFLTLIESSKTVQLNKNNLREWREITGQSQIDYGSNSKFNSHQKKIRENEVSKNLVTINPGLISKSTILIEIILFCRKNRGFFTRSKARVK